MRGGKAQLAADANAIQSTMKPPAWFSKHAKAEWRRVMPELTERRILTPADFGSLV
jgi:phage terminase small subunit